MLFQSWFRRPSAQPVRVFAMVLVVVSLAECVIMLAFGAFLHGHRDPIAEAFLDAALLSLIVSPAIWFSVVRPIQQLSASRGQLLQQLFTAQDQERARIGRDLHDELGQQLTALLLSLRLVEQSDSIATLKERAKAAALAAGASLDEVRRIARGLRPTVLEDFGLATAAERLCEEFQNTQRTRITVSITLPADVRFPGGVEMCLYRVLQEALTNCARHAQAQSVRVALQKEGNWIRLEVRDDGRGFDAQNRNVSSFGLQGMRERVELLDGRYDVLSAAGGGTTVLVLLPIPGTSHEPDRRLTDR